MLECFCTRKPETIQKLRKKLRITQVQMGQLLGCHHMTVSKWERGVLKPSIWQGTMLVAFARAVDVDPDVGSTWIGLIEESGIDYVLYRILRTAYEPRRVM